MKKANLTPSLLDKLSTGGVADALTPGLKLVVSAKGKKVWKYARRIHGSDKSARLTLGLFPAFTIAAAREWAGGLNVKVEGGIDPCEEIRIEADLQVMTVKRAHALYMIAVEEGRASRSKRKNKPRTISDKLEIYDRDIAPALARHVIHDVTEKDLVKLVLDKGKKARVRANRLAAELKVFFGWASGLRGQEVGLDSDPSRRLADLKFPESPRKRKLSLEELKWFLIAVAEEPRDFRRGLLLMLLSAARKSEVIFARSAELVANVWTIPAERSKNRTAHAIALGPWGRSLMLTNSEWVFPAELVEGPRKSGWYRSRDRVLKRMQALAGRTIERFNPHDFRRTARSNTKRLDVDFETAEAMLNHLKTGLERVYDGYELEEEKAAWFLKWETEVIGIADSAGLLDLLKVPHESKPLSPPPPLRPRGRRTPLSTRGRASPSRRARRPA